MGKMADFEKIIDDVGSPQELKKFYTKQGFGEDVAFKLPPGKTTFCLMEELSYCSGAALVTATFFTGDMKIGTKMPMLQTETLDTNSHRAFAERFSNKPTRIAYVTGYGHDFTLVKDGGKFALYQANVDTVPKYTLCKALNQGVEYNVRNMDAGAFAALMQKLTVADESNKIFLNKNNLSNYKAAFAEF
jgi:hypothetical protein